MIETSTTKPLKVDIESPRLKNSSNSVLKVCDLNITDLVNLLKRYNLTLNLLNKDQSITGSFWGDSEAGLIGNKVFIREDTPIHSLLHETCHYVCMDDIRRQNLNTNAGGGYDEENAVCYLQIALANDLTQMTSERMMQDMDSWGYTFRLGSTKAWFEGDAEDALEWLLEKRLLDSNNKPNYQFNRFLIDN